MSCKMMQIDRMMDEVDFVHEQVVADFHIRFSMSGTNDSSEAAKSQASVNTSCSLSFKSVCGIEVYIVVKSPERKIRSELWLNCHL